MGTRAVIVISGDFETYYVYRHSDGYPSSVLPEIRRGLHLAREASEHDTWKSVRPSYMSSLMISVNPWQFHATEGVHWDVEYIYHLTGKYENKNLSWMVEVWSPGANFEPRLWRTTSNVESDNHDIDDLSYWKVRDVGGMARYPERGLNLETYHVDYSISSDQRRSGFLDVESAKETAMQLQGRLTRTRFTSEVLGSYKDGEWIEGE